MQKIISAIFGLIVFVIGSTNCSECYYQEKDESSFLNENTIGLKRRIIYCFNVTPEVLLDFDEPLRPNQLHIEKSIIPVLPSNSSLSAFTSIQELFLSRVGLEKLSPGAFRGLDNLENLYLDWNNLTTIPAGVFDNLRRLKLLDLHKNFISVLEENCFIALSKLENLNLARNNLILITDKTFLGLINLKQLRISNNPLKEIRNFELPNLKYVDASETELSSFNVDLSQTKLDGISLRSCHLKEIDFALFPKNLYNIDLSYNEISSFRNFGEAEAKYLILSGNKITEIDVFPKNVVTLSIDSNKIKILRNKYPDESSNIEVLSLDYNEISEINSDSFLGLTKLNVLNFRHNRLTKLNANTFINCPNLSHLRLEHNNFQDVDPNTLAGLYKLQYIQIPKNIFEKFNSSTFSNSVTVFSDEVYRRHD